MEIQRGKVVTVERRARRQRLPGAGLIDGMAVVWRHWQGSFRKNEAFDQIHGTFTQEYPEERPKLPETYRNMPILLYDEESGHELCTSCFQCQRICPPQVIHMTQAKDPATGKAVPAVAEFVIEYDACMSCGFCAEVCPFDAIKMDHAFELSTADHPGLTVHKQALNRPIAYYERIAPTMWAEVREQALKKLQGNIKRRPDVIGMAPNLAEKIAARRRELAAQAAAAPPAPTAPPAPAAPAARLSPEEKAARLAAMKAANAAKTGAEAAPAAPPAAPADDKAARLAAMRAKNAAAQGEAPAPATEPPPAAPADDKAARLAAIRAKNAAAQGQTNGAEAAPHAPAAAVPAEATQGAGNGTPADEKAARLAAIRAANAAKQGVSEAAPAAEPEALAAVDEPAAPPVAGKAADEKAARLAAMRAANAAKQAADGGPEGENR
jgi:NADH-quinone oxidoreductase subunit I/electron transport complex protein RnfC